MELIPKKLLNQKKEGSPSILPFVQMDQADIKAHFDEQAIHAIETVIMMEYARCNDMSGEEVIKAFDGQAEAEKMLCINSSMRNDFSSDDVAKMSTKKEKHTGIIGLSGMTALYELSDRCYRYKI